MFGFKILKRLKLKYLLLLYLFCKDVLNVNILNIAFL